MDSQTGTENAAHSHPVEENVPQGESEFESHVPEGEELIRLLILNLEYLFSRDYLAQDPLLVSQLDSECNIPFKIIEEHPLIKSLTADTKIIHKALNSSDQIAVDQVRQVAKPKGKPVLRNTIILRDVPEGTTEEDVRALFGAAPTLLTDLCEMKPEFGNTFFIKFGTEEVTLEAWKHLRSQTLKDQPVQARIKSENLTRSAYYLDPALLQHYQQQSAQNTNPYTQQLNKGYHSYEGENGFRGDGRGRGRYNKRGGGGGGRKEFPGQVPAAGDDRSKGASRGRYNKRGGAPTTFGNQGSNSGKSRPNQNVSLAQWWPPLPSGEADNLTSGYQAEFKKYSKEQIVSIVGGVQQQAPPVWHTANSESIRPDGEALTANDLVKALPREAKIEWVENRTRRPSANAKSAPVAAAASNGQNQPKPQKPENPNKWASLLQNNNDNNKPQKP